MVGVGGRRIGVARLREEAADHDAACQRAERVIAIVVMLALVAVVAPIIVVIPAVALVAVVLPRHGISAAMLTAVAARVGWHAAGQKGHGGQGRDDPEYLLCGGIAVRKFGNIGYRMIGFSCVVCGGFMMVWISDGMILNR